MRLLAPSILSADFLHLENDIINVNKYGDIFHLDIMDGTFVPNISYGFPIVQAIAQLANKPLDVHLMIINPQKYFDRFAKAGANMISFHLEALKEGEDAGELLCKIKSYGVKAGLVINPDIPVERLYPYLKYADYVLIMSVFAGFGGQKFIESTYDKVRQVKTEIINQQVNCLIEVDGGVGEDNVDALANCGADIFVAGSAYFKSKNREEFAKKIKGVF